MNTLALLSTWALLASGSIFSAHASSAYTCTVFKYGSAAATVLKGINDKGQVVGDWYDTSGTHAFLRDTNGTLIPLTSPSGSEQFLALAINNLGQILGDSFIRNPDGSFIEIAPPAAPPGNVLLFDSQLNGINDKGEVSGSSTVLFEGDDTGTIQIFIRGVDGTYKTIDHGTTGEEPSLWAGSINNSDAVIERTGYSDGFLLRPNGSKVPLLLPGIPPTAGDGPGVTRTGGLSNNNVTVANTIIFPSDYAFLRTADGHYPAIVCPDALNTKLFVGGVNDNNVVIGSLAGKAIIATPTGVFPHPQLSNTSWTFASHVTGESGGLGRVFVSNTGPADLHIPGIYIGSSGQSHDQLRAFDITQTTCGTWLPEDFFGTTGTVPPGGSCFVEFSFTPQIARWQTAAIYIFDDSPQSPEVVQIGGTGGGGTLQVSNTSWIFAAHPVGETSGKGMIDAYNAGPGLITFNSQIVEAAHPSNFNLVSNTCGSLAPYARCSVTFNFEPSAPGEQTAILNLNDDSINGPIKIPLSGYGSRPIISTITDLGTLGGSSTSAYGINDMGQVVGWSSTANGEYHAMLWQNGKMIDLNTFPVGGYRPTSAISINNKGQVVGLAQNGLNQRAFLWQNGQTTNLGTLGGDSIANGINNNGQVVGASDSPSGQRAFLWQAGTMTDLGVAPGFSGSSAMRLTITAR